MSQMQPQRMPVFSYYQTLRHIKLSECYSNQTHAQMAQACQHHGVVAYFDLLKKQAA